MVGDPLIRDRLPHAARFTVLHRSGESQTEL